MIMPRGLMIANAAICLLDWGHSVLLLFHRQARILAGHLGFLVAHRERDNVGFACTASWNTYHSSCGSRNLYTLQFRIGNTAKRSEMD